MKVNIIRKFLSILLLVGLLFGSPGTLAAFAQTGLPADAQPAVKVLAPGTSPALDALKSQGASLLVDYGSFGLWSVPASQVNSLSRLESVEVPVDIDTIWLRGGRSVSPQGGEPAMDSRLLQARADGPQLWMVQFVGPVKDAWLVELAALGLEIVIYMPNNAYVVWGEGAALARLDADVKSSPTLQWSGAYHPAYRLAPGLEQVALNGGSELVSVTVQFYRTKNIDQSLATLMQLGGQVVKGPENVLGFTNLTLQVPASQLVSIASWPDVFNVEPWLAPEKLDEIQGQIIAGNVTTVGGKVVATGPGYLAWLEAMGFPTTPSSYPVVDVVDDGVDIGNANNVIHPDFHEFGLSANPDRVSYIANCTTDASGNGVGGHGNLNAAIVAGYNNLTGSPHVDANGYRLDLGISPYGRVASTKVFKNSGSYSVSGCGNTDTGVVQSSYNNGANFTSNSWGAPVGGAYDASSQAYDSLTRDASQTTIGSQQMLHIFSAGNSGSSSNTIGSPGTAKNVLTVSATENVRDQGVMDGCNEPAADNADDMADFSSRGPTDDQRVKPDISAPGTHVQAAASQDPGFDGSGVCGASNNKYYPLGQTLYTWSSGTSHSTPGVAGAASLVWNYYGRVLRPGSTPSPAMLKGLLLNTPRYLNGVGTGDTLPSNSQGWGDVNLGMLFDGTPRLLRDQEAADLLTETGQTRTFVGEISDPSKPLRVTLVWTDAPGATSGNSYNNNLNLEVTVGGQTYKGNVFNGSSSVTGGTADARNNVEGVFLPAGMSGAIQVKVTAANLPSDGVPGNGDSTDQDFALVAYNYGPVSGPALMIQSFTLTQAQGNSDGIVDPGETYDVSAAVQNLGSSTAANVNGVLSVTSGSATMLVTASAYPDIAAGAVQSNTALFRFRVNADQVCGQSIGLKLVVTSNASPIEMVENISVGQRQAGASVTYTYSGPSVAIPDSNPAGVNTVINVPAAGAIYDANVTITSLTHTYDGDLTLKITSPAGAAVMLSNQRGGSGDNFTNTVFDDEATTPISSGIAPFTGSFLPDYPLSTVDGSAQNGNWTLNVADHAGSDTGSIHSWSLTLAPEVLVCTPYSGTPLPEAVDDLYPATEDTPLVVSEPGVLANDQDPNGNPLSAAVAAGPAHGELELDVDGSFVYTPTLNFNGVDSFTYLLTAGGQTDSGVVTLNVAATADSPTAVSDSYTVTEDIPLSVPAPGLLANDFDVDGDLVTMTLLVRPPAHGELELDVDGSFVYTPASNYYGPDSFDYSVSDGSQSANGTVYLTVSPINDAPRSTGDTYTTAEDTPLIVPAPGVLENDTDVDGDVLSVLVSQEPAHGTLALNLSGGFVYTPAPDYHGSDSFTYTLSDGSLSDSAAVSLLVTPVNDPFPVTVALAPPAPETPEEGQALTFLGSFGGQEVASYAWSFGDGRSLSDALTATHTFADNGVFTVTFTVTNTAGEMGVGQQVVTVHNVAPSMANLPDRAVKTGQALDLALSFTDPGLVDTHSVTITWAPGVTETVALEAGQYTLDASHVYTAAGEYQVLVKLMDKDGAVVERSFTVTVTTASGTGKEIYLPALFH